MFLASAQLIIAAYDRISTIFIDSKRANSSSIAQLICAKKVEASIFCDDSFCCVEVGKELRSVTTKLPPPPQTKEFRRQTPAKSTTRPPLPPPPARIATATTKRQLLAKKSKLEAKNVQFAKNVDLSATSDACSYVGGHYTVNWTYEASTDSVQFTMRMPTKDDRWWSAVGIGDTMAVCKCARARPSVVLRVSPLCNFLGHGYWHCFR